MNPTTPLMDRLLGSPWFLIAALLIGFYWRLGTAPLSNFDEGAFSEAAREMIASGNYITPRLDGVPRYDKPALIYWLQAASVRLFGLNEFALRLPSAAAATLWVVAVARFAHRELGASTGWVAGLALATSLHVGIIARIATTDALINLLLALSFIDIYRHYQQPDSRAKLRAYAWMGLGFLAKGPVAVFFPVLTSLWFFFTEHRIRDWLRFAFYLPGWLLFLLLAGPWYVAIHLDDGPGFFRSFFWTHNLGRFLDPMQGHAGFPGYYFITLPLSLLPFSGWFLGLLPRSSRFWNDPLDRYLALWFVVVFASFSLSSTRLPHYMLHGVTPLFLLLARYRDWLHNRWLAFLPPLLFSIALLLLPELVQQVNTPPDQYSEISIIQQEGRAQLDLSYRLAALLQLIVLLALAFTRAIPCWKGLILAGVVQGFLVSGLIVPRMFQILYGPVKEAALLAKQLALPTVVYQSSMLRSFSVYREAITPDREPQPNELVFLRADKLEQLQKSFPHLRQELKYRRGGVALIKVTATDTQK